MSKIIKQSTIHGKNQYTIKFYPSHPVLGGIVAEVYTGNIKIDSKGFDTRDEANEWLGENNYI